MSPRLLIILIFLLSNWMAFGQVELRLTADRPTYLEEENIGLNLTITNRSGSDMELKTVGGTSWLNFKITSRTGEVISPVRRELFQRITIPRNTTIAKRIPITRFYALDQSGHYTVRANVMLPDGGNSRYVSNAAHVDVVSAPSFWSKRVGVPENEPNGGNVRHYELKRAIVERTNRVFVKLSDETLGHTVKVMQLGQALSSSEPITIVDREQTLHVLFQNTGVLYVHSRINIHGDYLGHQVYKRGTRRPTLVAGSDGSVIVLGGVVFDPQAEHEAKNKIRKLSERPAFHFR